LEAFRKGAEGVEEFPDAHTVASGIRVPKPTLESRYCVCYVRVGVPLLV
jgi:hypothetical protein